MNIYILDEQLQTSFDLKKIANKGARNWVAMVGVEATFITLDAKYGFQQLTEIGQAPLPRLSAGVLILHRPDESQMKIIVGEREKESCLVVLQVRGYAYEDEATELNWYYDIRTEVGLEDAGFSVRFKLFLNDLERSGGKQPNFSLLEPTAIPEPLLAYALAVQYGLNVSNILKLCADADVFYKKLQPYAKSLFAKNRAVSFPDVDVPLIQKFEPVPGDANGIRFKAMRNVIDLLREDL